MANSSNAFGGGTSGKAAATTYSYDALGRVIRKWEQTPSVSPNGFFVYSAYDLAGNLISTTSAAGTTITYNYSNTTDELTSVTSSLNDSQHPGTLYTVASNYPDGSIQKATFGNGLTETQAFNNRLQLCRKDINSSGTAYSQCSDPTPSGNVLDFTYGYNAGSNDNDNIVSWTATGQQTFARTFAYDNMNRILSMTDSASNQSCKGLSWTVDAWGNMVDQTTTSGSCYQFSSSVATNNRLNTDTYDAAGNVTYDGVHHYTYNADSQVLEVDGGSTASYVYNENGQRVRKNTSSGWTEYYYGPSGNVQSEFNGSWPVQYVYVGSRLLAIYQNNTTNFVHTDQIGTTRLITAVNQSIVDNMDYEPFGQQTAGNSGTTHKFTGKERDTESGNDYFGARYYASSMGRWLSPDPAGVAFSNLSNPQSWNLYSYVLNNPLIGVDPDGRECVWSDGSFDSKDDPDTGSIGGCQNAGGVYYDPSTFTAGNGQDWSAAPNAELAGQYQEAMDLAAQQPQGPDPSSATNSNTSTNGTTTTINLFGPNWQSTQVSTGTHPWRDNNPGDIISGRFVNNHGAIGSDGRFGVFPTAGTGSNALDSLLRSPTYSSKSISDAIATYAPAFENNTAGYQQFLTNALGVSGNTPLSSLSSSQMQTLENAISAYEGYNARGNFSVTTTSVITPP